MVEFASYKSINTYRSARIRAPCKKSECRARHGKKAHLARIRRDFRVVSQKMVGVPRVQRSETMNTNTMVTLVSGGHKTMESAFQVKGCKVNKKATKNIVHDDTRALAKDNSVNYSDDDGNNDETSKKNAKKNIKGSAITFTNTTPVLIISNNNNNTNSLNNKNNSNSTSFKVNGSPVKTATKNVSVGKVASNELPYNKVVSIGKATTTEVPYNKVVSNSISTNNELTYNRVVSNGIATANDFTYKVGNNKTNISNDSINNKVVNGSSNNMVSSSGVVVSNKELKSEITAIDDGISKLEISSDKSSVHQQHQPQQQVNDLEACQRRAVLSYEQVCRLSDVMNEVVSIHGRGNFPTLEVRLRDLVTVVKAKLEADPSCGGAGMKVRDIKLNGGAASHVLATESQPYNDLDLIFGVELINSRNYDKVKAAVLCSLFDLLPEGVSRKRITTCSLKEAYVSKMVKVNSDGDRWSLISLGNSRGHRNVELKFVDSMRRQFEFSVDSFQIVLDSLLYFHECYTEINENLYPTVVGESVYGDFHEALYHLQKKLISTRHPEEIRGGGLLKYCNLLVKMYKPAQPDYIKTLERYMCSRFFIDFPDIGQQKAKLENYLWNHFVGPEEEVLKYQYLMLLYSVVEESTVCLMGHERRQTLSLIENLAYQVLCQEQQRLTNHQAPPPAYVYANGYYYAPVIPTACYTCTCNSWMACSS